MKKLWRNLVSFVSRQDIQSITISSVILLYFVGRDLATVRYFLSKNGRKRIEENCGEDNSDRKTNVR